MKKILSVLLALCLTAACFAACSKAEEEPEETKLPLEITYDAAYNQYDESVYTAYTQLCTAIFNGESSVRMNIGMTEDVLQLYYTSFPLSEVVEVTENEDGSGMTMAYLPDVDTVKAQTAAFADKINEIKTACYDGTVNKTVYTLNVYRYICENYQEGDAATVLDTVLSGNGNGESYTRLFEYLLRQGGVPAAHIIATDTKGATLPMTQATLDGQVYYFDVMTERMLSGGKALRYFGMTSDELPDVMVEKTMYTNMATSAYASDLRFDSCRKSVSWEISGASLLVTLESGVIAELEL